MTWLGVDSDVIHLNLAGTHLLVVNSYEAAFELFERRSAIYNDKVITKDTRSYKHIPLMCSFKATASHDRRTVCGSQQ